MIQPVVICPLRHERNLIRKAVGLRAQIIVCGPGPDAVRKAVDLLAADPPPLVILCGVAGGLIETVDAPRIQRVLDRNARAWTVPVLVPGDDPAVALLALDEPVKTVERKQTLARAFAAALVDTESHAFAQACADHHLRWSVIRGVSDGPRDSLPANVSEWVDEKGRARIGRFLGHSILEPAAFFAGLRLRVRSRRAMAAASARLVELLNVEKQAATNQEAAIAAARVKAPQSAPRPVASVARTAHVKDA